MTVYGFRSLLISLRDRLLNRIIRYSITDHPVFCMENNLYNLEEDKAEEQKCYQSEYSIEDSIEEELLEEPEKWNGQTAEVSSAKRSLFIMMILAMFNPVEGFKALRRSKISAEKFASECFYPLIALASAVSFTQLFYDSESTVITSMVNAVVTFISIFFGYFTTVLCGKWLLTRQPAEQIVKDYGKIYLMTGFCSLCLFYILYRLFPILAPVWGLLPIWTIYIIWKGAKFLGAKGDEDYRTKVILSCLTILTPVAWFWLFAEILP